VQFLQSYVILDLYEAVPAQPNTSKHKRRYGTTAPPKNILPNFMKGLDKMKTPQIIFRAEQSRAEQSRAEQSRAEQSRAEQIILPFCRSLKLNFSTSYMAVVLCISNVGDNLFLRV